LLPEVNFYPLGECSPLLFRRIRGLIPLETSPVGDKAHTWGPKFALRGEVKNLPERQGNLRMILDE
jgi:hypothetical protein